MLLFGTYFANQVVKSDCLF